jgi:hypothetical protein
MSSTTCNADVARARRLLRGRGGRTNGRHGCLRRAGYLKVGPAIEALEREAPGLGATFYWILTYALHRILRVYNNTMISSTRNACRSTPSRTEREQERYKFPKVEEALQDCIRMNLQKEDHDRWNLGGRRLLCKHHKGRKTLLLHAQSPFRFCRRLTSQLVQKHRSRSRGRIPEIDATSRARSVSDYTKETANVKRRREG